MNALLRIDCSPHGAQSHSGRVADGIVAHLLRRHPGAGLVRRDLAADPPGHLDAAYAAAQEVPAGQRSAAHVRTLARSQALIDELDAADCVVLATPMHNYTVPAVLKAWIDHVVRVNQTFMVTPQGKVGRLRDRPVLVAVAAGGRLSQAQARQPDFLAPYLRAVFATIGIHSLDFAVLQGTAYGGALARAEAYGRDWARERFGA